MMKLCTNCHISFYHTQGNNPFNALAGIFDIYFGILIS